MANTSKRKFGGRKRGTPNKTTGDLRTWLTSFLEEQREQLTKDWEKLTPSQRIAMFEKLLRFCLPQLQSTELKDKFDKLSDEQINHLLKELQNGQKNETSDVA